MRFEGSVFSLLIWVITRKASVRSLHLHAGSGTEEWPNSSERERPREAAGAHRAPLLGAAPPGPLRPSAALTRAPPGPAHGIPHGAGLWAGVGNETPTKGRFIVP